MLMLMLVLVLVLVLDCAYVDAHGARFSGFLCFVFVLPCAYVYVASGANGLSLKV